MNKIFLIIQREFYTRVRKKSFIFLTLFMPLIIVAVILVPLWLSQISDDEVHEVGVVDMTHHYASALKDTETYRFVALQKMPTNIHKDSCEVENVVCITEDLAQHPSAVSIYGFKEVSPQLKQLVENQLDDAVRKEKLADTKIEGIEEIVKKLDEKVQVKTAKWDEEGRARTSSPEIAVVTGMIFTMLIYFFVLTYGMMVMQSVMEEKTNRIVEIMVSSVRPFQLLMGKIVGIALVGIAQLFVWAVLTGVLLGVVSSLMGLDAGATAQAQTEMMGGAATMPMPVEAQEAVLAFAQLPLLEMLVMFVLMFIGGYLFYASFFAAIGASVNEQEDSQQFVSPFMIFMAFALYAAIYSAKNTDGPLAFWGSMFPLTSPVVMMVRIPFGVPLWQEILSVVLLYASALGMVWIGAKIYRIGILIYGKKPTIKEMWRWLKYK